jgi:hypothetical protein
MIRQLLSTDGAEPAKRREDLALGLLDHDEVNCQLIVNQRQE